MATKLKPGRYKTTVFIGMVDGKRKYKTFYGETAREADYAAESYKISHKRNGTPSKMTVGEAIDEYIESRTAVLSPTTIKGYKYIRNNRFKLLMGTQIAKLNRRVLQMAVNDELKLTTRTGEPISVKSVKEACSLIVTAAKYVDEDFHIGDITYPRRPAPEYTTPDPDMLSDIFKAVKGTDVELPVYLAAWLSLRTSEIKGLKWSDVHDDYISITGAMLTGENGQEIYRDVGKTTSSIRKIPLPALIRDMFDTIPHGDDDFVFHFGANTIYAHYNRALRSAGLAPGRFHDLRHANASIMLMLGVPDRYAQDRGGWSSTHVMKSAYQQTFDKAALSYAAVIDDYFMQLVKS